MWVPVYDERGRQTGERSNVLYAIDLVRGLDDRDEALLQAHAVTAACTDAVGLDELEHTAGSRPVGRAEQVAEGGSS